MHDEYGKFASIRLHALEYAEAAGWVEKKSEEKRNEEEKSEKKKYRKKGVQRRRMDVDQSGIVIAIWRECVGVKVVYRVFGRTAMRARARRHTNMHAYRVVLEVGRFRPC